MKDIDEFRSSVQWNTDLYTWAAIFKHAGRNNPCKDLMILIATVMC